MADLSIPFFIPLVCDVLCTTFPDFLNVRHGLRHRDTHSLLHAGRLGDVDEVDGLLHRTILNAIMWYDHFNSDDFPRFSPCSVAQRYSHILIFGAGTPTICSIVRFWTRSCGVVFSHNVHLRDFNVSPQSATVRTQKVFSAICAPSGRQGSPRCPNIRRTACPGPSGIHGFRRLVNGLSLQMWDPDGRLHN